MSATAAITNNTLQDHQHLTTEIQPLQDLHCSTADFTNSQSSQDHHYLDTTHIQPFQDQQITVTTYSHTFQDHILHFHRSCTRISLQDHTHRYKDTFHNKSTTYPSFYGTRYNNTSYEDRRHRFL